MITYNFSLRRFQDSNGKIRSNISGLLSSSARKTLDPYKNKKEAYKDTLNRLQSAPISNVKSIKKVVKKGKIYEPGSTDDWSNDYDFTTDEEFSSAVYGYIPVDAADIYRRMRHRKKHRTPGKFMYDKPGDLRRKYHAIVMFILLKTSTEDGDRAWMLPIDFSFSRALTLKQIYDRIEHRSLPVTLREKNAAKRNRRSKNLSLIHRLNNFVIPAINLKYELATGIGSNWELDKIVGFMENSEKIKR